MDLIRFVIDFILHIDVHLAELVAQYGLWIYAILFLILFCETGLVVTPFLPGDSLLFVAGALAALPTNYLDVHTMVALMVAAAILGDAVNYTIGRLFGDKLFSNPNSKIFRRSYLDKTHAFYERHGGKTILLTTHYMEEAERLCDRVAIVDQGKVIALGSPNQLIAGLGGEHIIEFSLEGEPFDPANIKIAASGILEAGKRCMFGENLRCLAIIEGGVETHAPAHLRHLPPVGPCFAGRIEEPTLAGNAPL